MFLCSLRYKLLTLSDELLAYKSSPSSPEPWVRLLWQKVPSPGSSKRASVFVCSLVHQGFQGPSSHRPVGSFQTELVVALVLVPVAVRVRLVLSLLVARLRELLVLLLTSVQASLPGCTPTPLSASATKLAGKRIRRRLNSLDRIGAPLHIRPVLVLVRDTKHMHQSSVHSPHSIVPAAFPIAP